MKMPLGLAPQRSKVLPSLRVLTEETKLQEPASRPAIESAGALGSARTGDGMAAAARPSNAMNSRLSIATPRQSVFLCRIAHDCGRFPLSWAPYKHQAAPGPAALIAE